MKFILVGEFLHLQSCDNLLDVLVLIIVTPKFLASCENIVGFCALDARHIIGFHSRAEGQVKI